jgi:probable F420-dependent oxidoreductase
VGITNGGPRVGFAFPRASLAYTRSTVAALESLGVDSLWAPGHVASGRDVPEAMTGLATLAALTERATVGTAVLLAPLYHPVIVAKQAAELDRLTGGRVALGVGMGGEYPMEFRACQAEITDRRARTDEAIDVMRSLWTGREVDHDGKFWPFEAVSIAPRPAAEAGPPIIVAGRKPPAMRQAAVRGDGWMPFLYSPVRYAESVRLIKETAADRGRDLAGFQWMCFVYVRVDDDRDEARRRAAAFIGAGQEGDGSRFESLIDRVAVAGTSEDVRAGLQAFVDAGAEHLVVLPCEREDYAGAAKRILEEIVPAVEAPGTGGRLPERRGAALPEGGHRLREVAGEVAQDLRAALVLHCVPQRAGAGVRVKQLLGHPGAERGRGDDLAGHGQRGVHELVRGHHAGDQADRQCLTGVHPAPGEQQLGGPALANQPRQAPGQSHLAAG